MPYEITHSKCITYKSESDKCMFFMQKEKDVMLYHTIDVNSSESFDHYNNTLDKHLYILVMLLHIR
jgi:hypothetical protein